VSPDQTDQLETLVDRCAVIGSSVLHPVDQESLDVRLELAQHRIVHDQCLPGFESQERFDRPGRAGVKGEDALGGRALHEESQVDRQMEIFPLDVGQAELG
jgi:hypothetical protein